MKLVAVLIFCAIFAYFALRYRKQKFEVKFTPEYQEKVLAEIKKEIKG
jgi:hypothetical protein